MLLGDCYVFIALWASIHHSSDCFFRTFQQNSALIVRPWQTNSCWAASCLFNYSTPLQLEKVLAHRQRSAEFRWFSRWNLVTLKQFVFEAHSGEIAEFTVHVGQNKIYSLKTAAWMHQTRWPWACQMIRFLWRHSHNILITPHMVSSQGCRAGGRKTQDQK